MTGNDGALRVRRSDHRFGCGRCDDGGDPRRGGPRRDRRRGRAVGRAGFGRAVLAGTDGSPVPIRWRDRGARPPLDRLHRGPVRRAAAPRSTAACTADHRRRRSIAGARSTRSPTSRPMTSKRSATRSRLHSRCRPVPGAHTAASEMLRLGAERMGWRHDEIPRWMTYPEPGSAVDGKRQSMTETYLPASPKGRSTGARRASPRSAGDEGRSRRRTPSSPTQSARRPCR